MYSEIGKILIICWFNLFYYFNPCPHLNQKGSCRNIQRTLCLHVKSAIYHQVVLRCWDMNYVRTSFARNKTVFIKTNSSYLWLKWIPTITYIQVFKQYLCCMILLPFAYIYTMYFSVNFIHHTDLYYHFHNSVTCIIDRTEEERTTRFIPVYPFNSTFSLLCITARVVP